MMINMQTICMYISYQGGVYLQTIYLSLSLYIYIYIKQYISIYILFTNNISLAIYITNNVSFEFLLSLLYHMLPYFTLDYEIIMFFFSN